MYKLFQKIKVSTARLLARMFHKVCDPQVEAEVIDRRDYEFFQSQRRRDVEKYLSRYLGPRL